MLISHSISYKKRNFSQKKIENKIYYLKKNLNIFYLFAKIDFKEDFLKITQFIMNKSFYWKYSLLSFFSLFLNKKTNLLILHIFCSLRFLFINIIKNAWLHIFQLFSPIKDTRALNSDLVVAKDENNMYCYIQNY